jgi:hypothetical protein
LHPWNPDSVPPSLKHALEAARRQYATHGPLLAQAIRLREAAISLRQRARQLECEAFELEAVDAHLSRRDRPLWWQSNAAPGSAPDGDDA